MTGDDEGESLEAVRGAVEAAQLHVLLVLEAVAERVAAGAPLSRAQRRAAARLLELCRIVHELVGRVRTLGERNGASARRELAARARQTVEASIELWAAFEDRPGRTRRAAGLRAWGKRARRRLGARQDR